MTDSFSAAGQSKHRPRTPKAERLRPRQQDPQSPLRSGPKTTSRLGHRFVTFNLNHHVRLLLMNRIFPTRD